jgi:hypothetical protein
MRKPTGWMKEDGFWSAFFLIFLVTLGLLGMGAFALMRSEGYNIGNQAKMYQADYALDGIAFYGMRALALGKFTRDTETRTYTVGTASGTLDTSIASSGDIKMVVQSNCLNAQRELQIEAAFVGFADRAIITTSTVSGIGAKDSNFVDNSRKLAQRVDSIPTINLAGLKAIATTLAGNRTFNSSDYPVAPNNKFFKTGSTPNVTYVTGNLEVKGNSCLYGIWIVDGSVTISGTPRIYGVLYLPNVTSTIVNGGGTKSESVVTGAIVSHGSITGNAKDLSVSHKPTYMNAFCKFKPYPDVKESIISIWKYR